MKPEPIHSLVQQMLKQAGNILLRHFGKIDSVRKKEHPSSVVCAADLASEEFLVAELRKHFPHDNIISEECGLLPGTSEFTWVLDPLDGTSNFVARVPWFGVQMGRLQKGIPVLTAIYAPIEQTFYLAAAGQGLYRDGERIRLGSDRKLNQVLCAFGLDPSAHERQSRNNFALLRRVAQGVRNVRSTNSLIDFCYLLDGRFGACVNLHTKIWDIVPVSLMLKEAGEKLTDLQGAPIVYDLGPGTFHRSYAVLGASRALHPQLLALIEPQGR